MPHSQPTALQQTVCKFLLDSQYHIFHWGSTILGDSTLCGRHGGQQVTGVKLSVSRDLRLHQSLFDYANWMTSIFVQQRIMPWMFAMQKSHLVVSSPRVFWDLGWIAGWCFWKNKKIGNWLSVMVFLNPGMRCTWNVDWSNSLIFIDIC